jgi:hypothetical protein
MRDQNDAHANARDQPGISTNFPTKPNPEDHEGESHCPKRGQYKLRGDDDFASGRQCQ